MPIKVTCNNCGGVLHAPDDAGGKRGRCPTCGTVLTISGDAPRVAGSAAIPPASGPVDTGRPAYQPPPPSNPPRQGPGPGMVEASAGIPAPYRMAEPESARAPAFPRPPAATQSSTHGGRMPAPAKVSDPFMKSGQAPDAFEASARAWNRARRGLGWVQAGVFLLFLAAAACPVIELLDLGGVKVPDKDPGYLNVDGFSSGNEIRIGAVLGLTALGMLLVVLGRLGAAGAPRESFGRGIAKAAAWTTLLAFLGLLACGLVSVLSTLNGSPPKVVPNKDVLWPNMRFQERAERYVGQLFHDPGEPTGQVQRVGLVVLVVCGLVAELWFLSALGRYSAALQSPGASRRVTGFSILIGLVFILATVGLLVYNLFGEPWFSQNVRPKWNDLSDKVRAGIVFGGSAFAVLLATVLYYRTIGGVKRAIRETYDTSPMG